MEQLQKPSSLISIIRNLHQKDCNIKSTEGNSSSDLEKFSETIHLPSNVNNDVLKLVDPSLELANQTKESISNLPASQEILGDTFFKLSEPKFDLLEKITLAQDSSLDLSHSTLPLEYLSKFKHTLLLHQEKAILLQEHVYSELAIVLHNATLNIQEILVSFLTQLWTSAPLLISANTVSLTLVTVLSVFQVHYLTQILAVMLEGESPLSLNLKTKTFFDLLKPAILRFSNLFIWAKTFFIGKQSLYIWVVTALHETIQRSVVSIKPLYTEFLLFKGSIASHVNTVSRNVQHSVTLSQSFFSKIFFDLVKGVKHGVLGVVNQLCSITPRTWFFLGMLIVGTSFSSVALYVGFEIKKDPEKFFYFFKPFLDFFGFPASKKELYDFALAEATKQVTKKVEQIIAKIIDEKYASDCVDNRIKEALFILEEFFY